MSKLTEAQQILEAFGLPKPQQNERSALTLLALSNIKETDTWKDAKKIRAPLKTFVNIFI